MSYTRTTHNIESMVNERQNGAHDSPGSTEEQLTAWRTELLEVLRTLGVRDCQLAVPKNSKLLQGDEGPDSAHLVSENRKHVENPSDTETPAPASIAVRCLLASVHHSSPTTRSIQATVLSSSLNEDLILIEDAAPPSPTPGQPLLLDPGERALQRLISRNVPEDELASIFEAIFSSRRTIDTASSLTEGGPQTFIDAMDEVNSHALLPAMDGLIGSDFVLIGVEEPQPPAADPKEMPQVVIQDVCEKRPTSQITAD